MATIWTVGEAPRHYCGDCGKEVETYYCNVDAAHDVREFWDE